MKEVRSKGLFIWNVENKQIYRKQVRACQGWEERGKGEWVLMGTVSFLGWWNALKLVIITEQVGECVKNHCVFFNIKLSTKSLIRCTSDSNDMRELHVNDLWQCHRKGDLKFFNFCWTVYLKGTWILSQVFFIAGKCNHWSFKNDLLEQRTVKWSWRMTVTLSWNISFMHRSPHSIYKSPSACCAQ